MLQLLIADDEQDTRSVIREMIPWEDNGICVCGEASNGKHAIQLIEELHPDITLLDICMPLLDGIKVAQYTYAQHLDMENVILSGHDEFAYAQQAIKYGVSDYLLKPCKPEDILLAIVCCRDRLIKRRQQKNLLANMSSRLSEDNRALHEHALMQWLSGRDIDSQLSELFFSKNHAYCAVASFAPQSNVIQQMTARDFILQTLAQDFPICEVVDMEGRIEALVRLSEPDSHALYTACLHVWNRFALENQTISIGVGKAAATPAQVIHSYRGSVWMLEGQFFTQQNQVRLNTQGIDPEQLQYLSPTRQEKELLDAVRTGATEQIPRLCEEFFLPFQAQACTKANLINASLSLLLEIHQICETCGIQPPGEMSRYLLYEQLDLLPSFAVLQKHLTEFAENVSVRILRKLGGSSPVHSALRYIEQHYQEDIDLSRLAAHVHITPAYLSFIFKQTTGTNFTDHLNQIRIQKACVLMKNLECKAYEISDMVGFHDEKYFSKVFKKITGMSPSKYRKLNC